MSRRPESTTDAVQSAATVDMTIEIETYTCIRPSQEHPPKVPEAGEVSVDHDGYCVGVGNVNPMSTTMSVVINNSKGRPGEPSKQMYTVCINPQGTLFVLYPGLGTPPLVSP